MDRPKPTEEVGDLTAGFLGNGFACLHNKGNLCEVIQQIIDGLPDEIALLDERWNIVSVNQVWAKTTELLGYSPVHSGTNYLHFCHAKSSIGHSPAALVAKGISEIDAGNKSAFRFQYDGSGRRSDRTFEVAVKRIQIAGNTYATATRRDVTDHLSLRQLREDFSQSLVEEQNRERERVAREFHDSTVQSLVGLSLSISKLKRERLPKAAIETMDELEALVGDALGELRAVSYLAHPPMLQTLGLVGSLKALVDGFSRRTGLKITLQVDPEFQTASRASEAALYRIFQEALSNVYRHAVATDVETHLTNGRRMMHAVVRDNGKGLPAHVSLDGGLAGMRSRLSEMGGRLSMRSGSPGTVLIASIPHLSELEY